MITRNKKIHFRTQARSAINLLSVYKRPLDKALETVEEFANYILTLTNDLEKFEIGDLVTHKDIYDHNEIMEVKGVMNDQLLLYGNYSRIDSIKESDWVSKSGATHVI